MVSQHRFFCDLVLFSLFVFLKISGKSKEKRLFHLNWVFEVFLFGRLEKMLEKICMRETVMKVG